MADLYGRAWALVSRPGARTATEALWMACPLIFNHYGTTMPQEWLARRYFAARGLGQSIRRPGELAALVAQWLENPEAYAALRQRYQDHRGPIANMYRPLYGGGQKRVAQILK